MCLEQRFEGEMREACKMSAGFGYYPARFLEKMIRVGAVPYAKELVRTGELQVGLKRLRDMEKLNLSIEHLVARVPEFAPLFTEEERAAAEWRLEQVQLERR